MLEDSQRGEEPEWKGRVDWEHMKRKGQFAAPPCLAPQPRERRLPKSEYLQMYGTAGSLFVCYIVNQASLKCCATATGFAALDGTEAEEEAYYREAQQATAQGAVWKSSVTTRKPSGSHPEAIRKPSGSHPETIWKPPGSHPEAIRKPPFQSGSQIFEPRFSSGWPGPTFPF